MLFADALHYASDDFVGANLNAAPKTFANQGFQCQLPLHGGGKLQRQTNLFSYASADT